MADVYPFKAWRYNPSRVRVENVVTQPYDKISKAMQDRYYALDPHNIVRIVLGQATPSDSPQNNVYTRAAALLAGWQRDGVLQQEESEIFAVYSQDFVVPGTDERRVRRGFVGLGRLEDYKNHVVFPHERTLAGPKQDRLELLRHTGAHFEQIFVLYDDPARTIDSVLDSHTQGAPDIDVTDEYGVRHTLWLLTDPEAAGQIQSEMRGKTLIIADGHHRYETGLAFRDEMRSQCGIQPEIGRAHV